MRSIHLFNRNPSNWHSYYIANVEDSSISICKFLEANRKYLKTSNLVTFLIRNPSGNREFLPQFVSLLDFKGLEIDWAQRAFFMLLGVPAFQSGTNRLIETFASIYHSQNPEFFSHKGSTIFYLCFLLRYCV